MDNYSSVIPVVATGRTILYQEKFAGMYSSWAYSFAQVAIEVPYIFVQAILFVIINYPAIGYYWSVYKLVWYFCAAICVLLYFNYIGMLIVSLSPDVKLASILATACYTILNLFSGFLIPKLEAKEEHKNIKLMNALLRLHREVSPKLAACAADLSFPCPDFALGFGAVYHLLVSALACWPSRTEHMYLQDRPSFLCKGKLKLDTLLLLQESKWDQYMKHMSMTSSFNMMKQNRERLQWTFYCLTKDLTLKASSVMDGTSCFYGL